MDKRPAPTPTHKVLPVHILPQPDDETCGPTCLHAVYRYWGAEQSLDDLIFSARSMNITGSGQGTLAVMLGLHALKHGYRATLFTFNLTLFDPTWFDSEGRANANILIDKMTAQIEAKKSGDHRFELASAAYLEFVRLGGEMRFSDLTSELIAGFIRDGKPILTGLSATYLYRCAREFGPNDDYDDIRGLPTGHFVLIHGYDETSRTVTIADPLEDNPGFVSQSYTVPINRLVAAILLGVLTYDANLLIIQPGDTTPSGDQPTDQGPNAR